MAGQPNISSILATLTGPQQHGRPPYPPQMPPQMPLQMPPQHQQQQYHANQLPPRPQAQQQYSIPYQPAPPPPAVPQPNGSGMINLFDVRPSNSGSVSLGAPPPPVYQMAYPIPARSGYPPRRSRSRSPQRSNPAQYSNNYNPYREERRMESQVGHIRDQSSNIRDSPNARHSPLTGRRVSGPAQNTNADSHTETVMIESSVVGLVIGRQGENMRRLEAETRTRIQFAPASESTGQQMRKCTITGSKAAIEHAIAEIDRTIDENDKGPKSGSGRAPPPPGRNLSLEPPPNGASKPAPRKEEATLVIQVPSKTVGLIIGKRGESIKDLQDRSHCHVNIMPEEQTVDGMRPVHLLGTPQQAAVAQAMIMDIVNNDAKKLPDHSAAVRDGVNAVALGARTNNDKITDGIVVPSEAVGMIIGKGGETIRDMQDVTGCKINVSQPSGRDIEREIELIGSRAAIQEAKAGIMEKVRAVQEKNNRTSGRPQQQPQRDNSPYTNTAMRQSESVSAQSPSLPFEVGEPPGGHEAYAAYGGYQNYVALWYASTQGKPA